MKEIKKILDKYKSIDFSKRKAALATVVKVEGSSYRRPGARMLMTDDGSWEGAISGGCLEGDALRKSRKVILDGKPVVVVYDTMEESAEKLGVGLGCNGIIEILIEPIDEQDSFNPVKTLSQVLGNKETSVIATLFQVEGDFEAKAGDKVIYFNGVTKSTIKDNVLTDLLLKEVEEALLPGKSFTKTIHTSKGVARFFVEVIKPNIELVIFGGGYDAIPLVKLAKEIGWEVSISDECVAHLVPKRFPEADKIVFSTRDTILDKISISQRTAVVLLTHNYNYDKALLESLINTDAGYIGMLGPRKRFDKMLEEWRFIGLNTEELKAGVNSPIGLDVGAETPEEIALSIIAEIRAHFSNRNGGSLKVKQGPIHEREPELISINNSAENTSDPN